MTKAGINKAAIKRLCSLEQWMDKGFQFMIFLRRHNRAFRLWCSSVDDEPLYSRLGCKLANPTLGKRVGLPRCYSGRGPMKSVPPRGYPHGGTDLMGPRHE